MSSFTTPLVTKDLDGNNVEVLIGFRYHLGALGSPTYVCVPSGFRTDYASSPWGFRNIFPKFGDTNQPAVLHDYLYRGGYIIEEYTLQENLPDAPVLVRYTTRRPTRAEADHIFLEACRVRKVPEWKQQLGYRMLRVGGGLAWNKGHRPATVAKTRALEAADPKWPLGILAFPCAA